MSTSVLKEFEYEINPSIFCDFVFTYSSDLPICTVESVVSNASISSGKAYKCIHMQNYLF